MTRLVWDTVTIDFKGRTIEGLYAVDRGTVIVHLWGVEKKAQVGGLRPAVIAQMVLRELANEAERDQTA
jgi:hypothetical protein